MKRSQDLRSATLGIADKSGVEKKSAVKCELGHIHTYVERFHSIECQSTRWVRIGFPQKTTISLQHPLKRYRCGNFGSLQPLS